MAAFLCSERASFVSGRDDPGGRRRVHGACCEAWTRPRALRPGDRVGVCAPAGAVDLERLDRGVADAARARLRGRGRGRGPLAVRASPPAPSRNGSATCRRCGRTTRWRASSARAAARARAGSLPRLDAAAMARAPQGLHGLQRHHLPPLAAERPRAGDVPRPDGGASDLADGRVRRGQLARPASLGEGTPYATGARRHARRCAPGDGGGPPPGRVPLDPGRGGGHAVGAPARPRGHDPLPGGRGRAALPHRPHAHAAARLGRLRRRARDRLRRHAGLHPEPRRGLHARGRHPRRARRPRRAHRHRPVQRPHAQSQRHAAVRRPGPPHLRRTTPGSRSWRPRSHEGASLGDRGNRHGLAGRPAARAGPRGERLRPGRLPADVHPARGAGHPGALAVRRGQRPRGRRRGGDRQRAVPRQPRGRGRARPQAAHVEPARDAVRGVHPRPHVARRRRAPTARPRPPACSRTSCTRRGRTPRS